MVLIWLKFSNLKYLMLLKLYNLFCFENGNGFYLIKICENKSLL
jgi:hypothetical protein